MRALIAACALVLLSGCAALTAENPHEGWAPVNAVADGADRRVLIFGNDVVSYFTDNRAERGSPDIRSEYKGVTLRFASAEHKALFDRSPEKYLPQFGGYCTNGIVYGIPLHSPVNSWWIHDGKLYMFGGPGAYDGFMLDPVRNLALAEKYWHDEIEGRNAQLQSAKRLVFRVGHYKTGAELAAEVRKAKN